MRIKCAPKVPTNPRAKRPEMSDRSEEEVRVAEVSMFLSRLSAQIFRKSLYVVRALA